ncbi:MAG: hypothetical protein K0Q96_2155 [Rubrobacteraceae bacterium]|nr:hypothetical protein [Rubrobacteraceae bacterium]
MRLDHRIELALHQSRLDDTTPPFEIYLQRPTHLGDVEGQPGGCCLPGQGGTSATRRNGEPEVAGCRESELHVLFRAGDDDAHGLAEVDGGIRGPHGA